MKENIKGVWFCGLAGSGKSYASRIVSNVFSQGFLIDGDVVRKYVSTDLGYDVESRKIQIKRILGISQIAIGNRFFPIASSVYMSDSLAQKCKSLQIEVIRIVRPESQLLPVREIYTTEENVVGKDIVMPELSVPTIENTGTKEFEMEIRNICRTYQA